jgi:hypothetical protein
MYCIPCKISVCRKCNYEEHKNHILISKKDFHFTPQKIDLIYDSIQKTISSDKIFVDHKPIIKELSNQIEQMCQYLYHKVDQLKEMKMKEISKMFKGFSSNINNLRQRIEKARNELKIFYNENKNF